MKTVYRKFSLIGMVLFSVLAMLLLVSCPSPLQDTDDGTGGDDGLPNNLSVVYVSTVGDDGNGGDSPDAAKRTIAEALLRVAGGGDIKIAGGTYNETVVFAGSANFLGSYNEDFSATDFSTHPTIIDGSDLSGS